MLNLSALVRTSLRTPFHFLLMLPTCLVNLNFVIAHLHHPGHLTVRLELHNPEDDVSARAAVTEGLEAAAEAGRALHHEHVLVGRVLDNSQLELIILTPVPRADLDDVGGLQDAQGLLHVARHHPRGALHGHALGDAGAQQAVVTLQRSLNNNRYFSLGLEMLV